jgi:hypothetical protein
MGSEWAKEAGRQAELLSQEAATLSEGARVTYQKREARFALKAGGATAYFSAHDYEKRKGTDWVRLRKDILAELARRKSGEP